MPPNRVIHQLLTGRKRRSQSIGASSRAISSRCETAKHDSDAENSRTKVLSSKTSDSNNNRKQRQTDYRNRNSERQLIVSPSKNQIQSSNFHLAASGIEMPVATNEPAAESLPTSTYGTRVAKEHSTEPSTTFPARKAYQQLEPQKCSSRYQQHTQSRYRRRYNMRRIQRGHYSCENGNDNGIETYIKDVDVYMTSSDNKNLDYDGKIESFASTGRRRHQSRQSKAYSRAIPLRTRNSSDAFAQQLVRTFLEQRGDKRFISSHTLLSSSPSLLDDPMLLPVFLLGISALSNVIEWYDQKRKEVEFSQSVLVRELVLWMKDRQELHAAYNSETIVRKHVDTLNQLAKFQESIENSHETSLILMSQQREDDEEIEERRRNQKKSNFEAENTAEEKMNNSLHHFGLYERGISLKDYENEYKQTGASDNSSLQLKEMGGYETRYLQKQHKRQEHLEVEESAKESNLEINIESTKSKQAGGPRMVVDPAVFRTKVKSSIDHSSNTDINEQSVGDKFMNSTIQVDSVVHDATLSSVPIFSDYADRSSNTDPQIDNTSQILMSANHSLERMTRRQITKPSSLETNVGGEEKKSKNRTSQTGREVQQRTQYVLEESKNAESVEHEDVNCDGTNSVSLSDDMSQVLLSQSRKRPPRSRRVTVSPRRLSDNKARNLNGQYQHNSKINFTGHHRSGDRKDSDIYISCPSGKVKRRRKDSTLKHSPRQSLQKAWVSSAQKRSPSFKQTSLTPSASGWVSNQGARNFVKDKRSPGVTAMVQANPSSGVQNHDRNSTGEKGAFSMKKNDCKGRTPIETLAISQKNDFGNPTSKIMYGERNIARKMTNKEIPGHDELFTQEQQNNTVSHTKQRHGSQPKNSPGIYAFVGINDFESSSAEKKVDKNNDNSSSYEYEEVVRGKEAREGLIGNECKECAVFFDEVVLQGDGAKCYDRDELLRCNRHRARRTPPQTPEDFWELSFRDEKLDRTKQETAKSNN